MKISTRVENGLIALTDIVIHCENGNSVSAPDIAERQNISHKYLEQILLSLRQAGFIKAQKGIRGGYALACPPDQISLSDVLNALDNTILAKLEVSEKDSGLRPIINDCFWSKINNSLNIYAESMTLSEFVAQCQRKIPVQWDNYVI